MMEGQKELVKLVTDPLTIGRAFVPMGLINSVVSEHERRRGGFGTSIEPRLWLLAIGTELLSGIIPAIYGLWLVAETIPLRMLTLMYLETSFRETRR